MLLPLETKRNVRDTRYTDSLSSVHKEHPKVEHEMKCNFRVQATQVLPAANNLHNILYLELVR